VIYCTGVFSSDDDKEERGAGSSGDETDEILTELKKKQAELRALSQQNAIMLRHLHKQAKDELQRQELKKKMAAADAEVSVQVLHPTHSNELLYVIQSDHTHTHLTALCPGLPA